eukprot:CAMPEP_0114645568 /NCGR_PEP_ID=MMETSP0191-20121206/4642_1 /TAXON_ID=126664 /ORGANISM="Sorites sp." /LENGTH=141 /DNA_ID=CAMNT_0001858249 /DNA_START=273 /DNA_END=696 /DNA_ORIENTATION=-
MALGAPRSNAPIPKIPLPAPKSTTASSRSSKGSCLSMPMSQHAAVSPSVDTVPAWDFLLDVLEAPIVSSPNVFASMRLLKSWLSDAGYLVQSCKASAKSEELQEARQHWFEWGDVEQWIVCPGGPLDSENQASVAASCNLS